MLVDIVFPGWIPFAYLAIAKDTAGFIQAHDIALNNYDFDNSCWTPHKAGNQSGRGGAERICHRFGKETADANQNVSGIANQVGSFDNPWLLFREYIDTINKQCEDEMLPKWKNRLGELLRVLC